MSYSDVDYTIFFRELSHIPEDMSALKMSFYTESSQEVDDKWQVWLKTWRDLVSKSGDLDDVSEK
ncbi:MAG: hypothetical protein NE334_15665 [Lentisphaeraceae bacterium]|nr:hypothetical protein [Lentisphaeraceae bacterium]